MKQESLTVSMGVTLFEDDHHRGPDLQNFEAVNRFLAPTVADIFRKYYPEAHGDTNRHWNYDTRFSVIRDFGGPQTRHLEFRDRQTGAVVNRMNYLNLCTAAKENWKRAVMQAYPAYNRAALEEGMRQVRFEYFPQSGLLVGFTLLNGLVREGTEDLMTEEERNSLQGQPTPKTLYVRFDIGKLSGAYGADSYRILFTSVASDSLCGGLLRMGDSRDTLAGRENVNVIGITMTDSARLEDICRQLSAAPAFMAVADARAFSLAEGTGEEPLVIDGVLTTAGVQVQGDGFSWAKHVWEELEQAGKVSRPVTSSEQSGKGLLTITYGNIQEAPFPAGVVPLSMFGAKYFAVSNGKILGNRFGVLDLDGRVVVPVEQKYSAPSNGRIKFELLNNKGILVEAQTFTLYNMAGNLIGTYRKAVNLGSELLAVSNGGPFTVIRLDGSQVTGESFDFVRPFADGISLAKKGRTVFGYSTDWKLVYMLTDVEEIRDYCNGYAVFKRGKLWGAVDAAGKLALEPKWIWLRDASFDAFVFSDSDNPKVNESFLGLVAPGDQIVLPCKYKNLEQVDANLLKHGPVIVYRYQQNNYIYTKTLSAFGLIDKQGKEIVPAGVVGIGRESEGLRAYARYISDEDVEFGYMDADRKPVFIVARAGKLPARNFFKSTVSVAKEYLFVFKNDDLLSPFFNGKALVKLEPDGCFLKDGRWVDRSGTETTPGQVLQPVDEAAAVETGDIPDERKAQEALKRLGNEFTTLGYNFSVIAGESPNKKCRRLAGDLWEVETSDGKVSYVLSQLESTNGFSCGLLAVKHNRTRKWGYADPEGNLVVPPKYDEAKAFKDNRAWARVGKQYFILKREAVPCMDGQPLKQM